MAGELEKKIKLEAETKMHLNACENEKPSVSNELRVSNNESDICFDTECVNDDKVVALVGCDTRTVTAKMKSARFGGDGSRMSWSWRIFRLYLEIFSHLVILGTI